jgi:hypothetical protein
MLEAKANRHPLAVAPGHEALGPGPRGIVGVAMTPATATVHPEASSKGKSRAERKRTIMPFRALSQVFVWRRFEGS